MKIYTWKFQYTKYYTDQYQDKGEIDLEKAIEEFQMFPWEKQVDDYKGRTGNATVPNIVFTADDNRLLKISSTNLKGFDLEYFNYSTSSSSKFYISNNFNKKNWTVEEIIEFFFNNELEKHIKLSKIESEKSEPVKEVKTNEKARSVEMLFRPQHLKTIGSMFFLWFGVSVFALVFDLMQDKKIEYFVHILIAMIWFPDIILHLTYYLRNYMAKVIIDTRNHNLTYIKGTKEIKFSREDIYRCQVTQTKSNSSKYSYVWFVLNSGENIVITCFIADPYTIADTLNCHYDEVSSILPLLP